MVESLEDYPVEVHSNRIVQRGRFLFLLEELTVASHHILSVFQIESKMPPPRIATKRRNRLFQKLYSC
jgi:hypothetical protein